jgi:hypothetical protein
MNQLINRATLLAVVHIYPNQETDLEEVTCEVLEVNGKALFTLIPESPVYFTEQSLLQALALVRQHQRRIDLE